MTEMINLSAQNKEFVCYKVEPAGKPRGGLIVIHEVWGLDNHIRDVAERFAREGYLVLAPDLLGGTGMDVEAASKLKLDLFDPERRSATQPKLRELMTPINAPEFGVKTVNKLQECFNYLYSIDDVNKKVAVAGFCFGGSYSFSMTVNEPRLKAAAPFYGHTEFSVDELKKINCPILAFYGQNDQGLIANLPSVKQKMREAKVDFNSVVYPACGHAFFNDTNKFTYNKQAAEDSWSKVLDFLGSNLK
jgi:carboxymethylenebutenolidase